MNRRIESPPQRPSCRGCRILRAEVVRQQHESEARAAEDAQRCVAMYDHMERLARLNMALTQQRKTASGSDQSRVLPAVEKQLTVMNEPPSFESGVRERKLQATIVDQARAIERLKQQLQSSVPMLPLDGTRRVIIRGDDSREGEDNQSDEDVAEQTRRLRHRGLEKLPLTSLHAQLRARDATIHRLEHHVTELTDALDASREKKSRAAAQYQQITKSLQTQLKKYAARLDEQQRTHRESEREIEGLKAYVAVLEKKLLGRPRSHGTNWPSDDPARVEFVSHDILERWTRGDK